MFERGKIVLVPFPFTDLSSQKVRPAVIVSMTDRNDKDVVVVFVTTRTAKISKDCLVISEDHPAFGRTGFKTESVIRADKIATLDRRIVLGELGALPSPFMRLLHQKLKSVLGL
ncbi:MAG: type II toxin-antitoxin system PemK/MazF family toxin [Patescibacteria group bacterium]